MLENWHLFYEPQSEGGEIICTLLGGTNYQYVFRGIKEQLVTDKGRGDPTFADPTKGLDAESAGAVLQVVRYVILDISWFGQPKLVPRQE